MSYVRRRELEQYIGKSVKIKFLDNKVRYGVLGYVSDFCEEQGWKKPGYFTLGNLEFKVSHIKKVEETLK